MKLDRMTFSKHIQRHANLSNGEALHRKQFDSITHGSARPGGIFL